jgi:hypothetical protein
VGIAKYASVQILHNSVRSIRQIFVRSIPATNRLLIAFCILLTCGWSADVQYIPDRIGKATVALRADNYGGYGLPDKEMQAYCDKLRRIADWIVAQPGLSPPRGFNIRGWVMVVRSGPCSLSHPCLDTPIAALASVPFFAWALDLRTRKEFTEKEFGEDLNLSINDPWTAIENRYEIEPAGPANPPIWVDEKGNRFLIEPRHLSDVDGCPIYEDVNGNRQFLVVTKISRPLFLPLSREVYLHSLIRWWEKQLKSSEDAMEKMEAGPAAELYRKWMAESKERARIRQQTIESIKKSNPEKADAMLHQMEDTEQKVTANFQRDMEKEQSIRAQGKDVSLSRAEKDLAGLRDVLSQLQRKLAAMTLSERSAQARYMNNRPWESIDSPEGAPLVVINPGFMDRSLPRSAIQVIVSGFNYDRGIERGEKLFMGTAPASEATHLGVWRMKKESRWSDLKTLMAGQ